MCNCGLGQSPDQNLPPARMRRANELNRTKVKPSSWSLGPVSALRCAQDDIFAIIVIACASLRSDALHRRSVLHGAVQIRAPGATRSANPPPTSSTPQPPSIRPDVTLPGRTNHPTWTDRQISERNLLTEVASRFSAGLAGNCART